MRPHPPTETFLLRWDAGLREIFRLSLSHDRSSQHLSCCDGCLCKVDSIRYGGCLAWAAYIVLLMTRATCKDATVYARFCGNTFLLYYLLAPTALQRSTTRVKCVDEWCSTHARRRYDNVTTSRDRCGRSTQGRRWTWSVSDRHRHGTS